LDIMAGEITTQLKEMGLIWEGIQEQFKLLVLNLIVSNAIEMGFLEIERDVLMEGISQSKFLNHSKEGLELRKSILDNKIEDINFNTLTII